jgi:tetratricopeptide (TPR) repeat protein
MSPLIGPVSDPSSDASPPSSTLTPQTLRTYYVFLASPGDVQQERAAVREFFDRYNRGYAEPRGLRFQVVDWENYSSAGVGRPQELITRQTLERFRSSLALVIGVMAQRFGSPTGTHDSGTEEELEWAVASWKESGFPEIKWFFRDVKRLEVDPAAARQGVEQWEKVQAFRRRLEESKPPLYTRSYADLPGFRELIDNDLGQWLNSPERPWFAIQDTASSQPPPSEEPWLRRLAARLDDSFVEHIRSGEQLPPDQARARYVPLIFRFRQAGADAGREGPLEDFLHTERRLLVVGPGGGGKTTTLRHLAAQAAQAALKDTEAPLPVYLRLNTFDRSEHGFDALLSLLSFAADLEPGLLEACWRNGSRQLLFLLDGLNEVAREHQEACVKAVLRLLQEGHIEHRYVVTTRPGSELERIAMHPTEHSGLKALEVLSFDTAQIRRYLGAQGNLAAYERISNYVHSLAANPFLLWAVTRTLVVTSPDRAPFSRGGLFRALIDHYIFAIREQGKPPPRPTRYHYERVKKPVASGLALEMTERGVTTVSEDLALWRPVLDRLRELHRTYQGVLELRPKIFMPEDYSAAELLDEIVDNGVLLRESGSLRFMHESVQEYFTASALHDRPLEALLAWVSELDPNLLDRNLLDPDLVDVRGPGFETIVMLAGLLASERASSLAEALLVRHPLLAAHVGNEAGLAAGLAERIWDHFLQLIRSRHEGRRLVGARCLQVFPSERSEVVARLVELLDDLEVREAARKAVAAAASESVLRQLVEAVVAGSTKLHDDERAQVLLDVARERPGDVAEALLAYWGRVPDGDRPRLARLAAYVDTGPRFLFIHFIRFAPEGRVREALLALAVDAEVQGQLERAAQADSLRRRIAETTVDVPSWGKQIGAHLTGIVERQRRRETLEQDYQALSESELVNLRKGAPPLERTVALDELVARRSPLAIEPVVDWAMRASSSGWSDRLLRLPLEPVLGVLAARAADAPTGQAMQARRLLALLGEQPGLDRLQQVLDEEDVGLRVVAAWAAGRVGPSALDFLRRAVRVERAAPVIKAILDAIAALGERPAQHALLDLMFDAGCRQGWPSRVENDDERIVSSGWEPTLTSSWTSDIHRALVAAGARDATLERVRAELQVDPARRREAVAEARRWLPDSEALALLQQAANGQEADSRRWARWILAREGDTERWRQLLAAELNDPSSSLSFALDVTRRLTGGRSSGDPAAYAAAAGETLRPALAAGASQRRARALDLTLHLPEAWLDDAWRGEAIAAAEQLLRQEDEYLAGAAVAALSQLDPDRERLVALLDDERSAVQRQALQSLGEEATPILQKRLEDAVAAGNAAAARRIVTSLPDSGRAAAARAVARWLANDQASQREAALCSLGRLWSHVEQGDQEQFVAQVHAALARPDGDQVWLEYCRRAAGDPKDERAFAAAILRSFHGAEQHETLARLAQGAAAYWPDDPDPLWVLSWSHGALGRTGEAHAGFEQLGERFDATINHAQLARAFGALDEPENALRHARRAVERDPDDYDGHFLAGCYAYVTGDLQASVAATRRALELRPLMAMAQCNLALALLAQGQPHQALTHYRRAVAIGRRSPADQAARLFEDALADLDALTKPPEVSRPAVERTRALLQEARQEVPKLPTTFSGPS